MTTMGRRLNVDLYWRFRITQVMTGRVKDVYKNAGISCGMSD